MKDFFDPLGLALLAAILVPNLIFALLFAPCHITLSARNALAQRKETGL